jgi:RNA polymerase sigma-70 factor (ECF subfamily)
MTALPNPIPARKTWMVVSKSWAAVWSWLARPNRYRGVHNFCVAAESADPARLATLLDPGVAIVVDAGDAEHSRVRVVGGVGDATALLVHGMAARPGLVIDERSINGQAGLMLNGDDAAAAINIDFTGRLISVVWILLRPEQLRHGNRA